jgi:hypothetical protein
MFNKHPLEMTFDEIDAMVDNYFETVEKTELFNDLISSGFKIEDLNFSYFFGLENFSFSSTAEKEKSKISLNNLEDFERSFSEAA